MATSVSEYCLNMSEYIRWLNKREKKKKFFFFIYKQRIYKQLRSYMNNIVATTLSRGMRLSYHDSYC